MASDPPYRQGREQMASSLPEDVLVQILMRLPAKSLLRCLSVSKSWHSLISSPAFISHHISSSAPHTLVLRLSGPGPRRLRYTLHHHPSADDDIAVFPFSNDFPRILGPVNGLICTTTNLYSSFKLWNPAIRKSLILPNPTIEMSESLILGFGFDPVGDDYKVVRVFYGGRGPLVEVYRLRARSWCRVDVVVEADSTLPLLFPRQAYLDGVVHWLGEDPTIVGFDLRSERFTVVKVPGELEDKRMEDVVIAAWCGRLALFEMESGRRICMWVMREYGEAESWMRQCVISCVSFPERVKGIASDGRVLVEDSLGLVFWFDPVTRERAELTIQDVGDVDMFHVKAYAESLVLLGMKE